MLDGEPATPHAKVRFFAEKNRSEGTLPNRRENVPCGARETPAHSSARNLLAKRPFDNASEKPRKPPKSLQIGRLRRKNRIWRTVRAGPQYPGTSCLRGQGSRRHDVPRGKAPGAVRNARGSRGCPGRARPPVRKATGGRKREAAGAQDYPGRARPPRGARPLVRAPISNAMRRHARASASSHRNRSPSPARCCRFDAPSSLYSAP